MSTMYRYVNKNPFEIYLPDQFGGSILVQPGEGTTDQWFSRFVGERQLTAIAIPSASAGTPVVMPNTVPVQTQVKAPHVAVPHSTSIKMFPDKETADYSLKNGVYSCKKCDGLFSTGSNELLASHFATFHLAKQVVPQQTPKLGTNEGEGEVIVGTTRAMTPAEPKDEERHTMPQAPAKPATPTIPSALAAQVAPLIPQVAAPGVKCQYPGCEKVFASERGLNMHNVRVHGEKKAT